MLIIKHSDEGTLGLILNRPSGTKIAEIWGQVSSAPCHVDQPIHTGGPIQGPLMALHSAPAWSEIEVVPGVYFTAARESLEEIVSATEARDAAQHPILRRLCRLGTGPARSRTRRRRLVDHRRQPASTSFSPTIRGRRLTRLIGGSQLLASLGIKHVPSDPRLN